MKIRFLTLLIISALSLNAQTERGTIGFPSPSKQGTTRAMIIGISSYSNLPLENQLDYADDDAMEFYTLLHNRPDLIEPQNISLFLNEDATGKSKIFSLLSTYYKESEEGDLIILYFAGHGDIQNIFGEDDGFLLLHNVSPDGDYYYSDAININELNRFIQGIAKKNVNVLLITDACRSGKLLSSQENTQRVLSAISQEYEKVLKLVSCQVNQASFEGKQWGNGHGVFSYYLINGMKGLADRNSDKQIRFGELSRFIINNVLDETNEKQEPEKSGNSDHILMSVDENLLAEAQNEMSNNALAFNTFTPRNALSNRDYFFDLNPGTKRTVDKFKITIAEGALLKSDSQKSSIRNAPIVDSIGIAKKEFYRFQEENIYTLSLSVDEDRILSGGGMDKVRITDLNTGDTPISFDFNGLLASDTDPRGSYFATSGWNQKIQIWNYENGVLYKEVLAHADDIRTIRYNTRGNLLASSGDDRNINFWNTDKLTKHSQITNAHSRRINDLVFVDNDEKIISVSNDGRIKLWDIASLECLKQHQSSAGISCVELSWDKSRVVTGEIGGAINIWDLESFNNIKSIQSGLSHISSMVLSPGMKYAFVGGKERQIILIDIVTGNKVLEINTPFGITDMAVSRNFRSLEIGMYSGYRGSIKLDVEMSGDLQVAEELYAELFHMPEAGHISERLSNYFTLALQKDAHEILNAFISGNEITVSDDLLEKASAYLDKAIEINSENDFLYQKLLIDRILLDSYSLLKCNDVPSIKKAVVLIEQVKEELPDASFTHNTLVAFYQKLNELENAKESARTAIRQIPDWTEPKLNLGRTYFLEGAYQDAIREYELVLKSNPEHSKAHKYLGDVLVFLGYYEDARIAYENAIKYDTLNISTYVSMADLFAIMGNYSKAENQLKKAEAIDIHNENLIVTKARIMRSQAIGSSTHNNVRNFVGSFHELRAALSVAPNSSMITLELAHYYSALSYHSELFGESCASIAETDSTTYGEIREFYAAEAEKLYSNLIQRNPFCIEAYAGIGDCLFYKQAFFLARNNNKQMLRKFDDSPEAAYLMGTYFLKREKEKKALSYFKKAISINPNYTPAIYSYALNQTMNEAEVLSRETEAYSSMNSDLFKDRKNLSNYRYLKILLN